MNSDELLIDDSEFPVYLPVEEWTRKFEEKRAWDESQHPRDKEGQFAEKPSLAERYPVEPYPGGFAVKLPGGGLIAVTKSKNDWMIGGKPQKYATSDDAILEARLLAADKEPKPKPPFKSHTAEEAEQIIAKAKAEGQRVLFHSGSAAIAAELAEGIRPQMGGWVEEVLSGATDDEEAIRQILDDPANAVAYYSETPEWVSMKASHALEGRHVTDVTPEELEQHGHLSIVVVDPDSEDLLTSDENQMVYRVGSEEARREEIPFGVEPGDIYTQSTLVPDVTLTGKELLRFLNRNYSEANLLKGTLTAFKSEHDYGNTQIQIAPTSSAAASLNMARDAIRDADCMGTGKDVDPNHLTVRYGLLNDDLDRLRSFIAAQEPFEAHLMGIELFPASEHSEGAVPVVARIASPELHTIENAIGDHADFKEKSFPVYKPHCTLAYCTPEAAEQYQDLFVHGSFIVQSITISHQSGVQETIPFGMVQKWDEDLHPRDAQGQFTENRERKEFVEAAIRRGEAHTVFEDEFVSYHFTGHIPSNAYEKYEAGEMDFIHRKDFDTLLDTREVNGQTVEIRLQTETPTYTKWTEDAPKAERDRLYEEYEQEAKRLGTTPMMAGIDLGWGSPAYESLKEFERRYFASGSHAVRDEQGNAVQLTPEEVKAKGLPTESYTVAAFVGDKAVGYAGDEFGASGVYVARTVQRHGIGLTLLKTYLEKSGRLAKGRSFGQMTGVGQGLVRALHRQLVKEAAAKKKDPVSGRYVTPFVSFDKQGDEQLRMIASLNSSRLATWGFTAEAEVLGMARYKLTAVLDGRTSKFCRLIDKTVFNVPDARRKVIEVLNVQNPEDLRTVQPWPKQTKQALAEFAEMTPAELTARGLHIPPYHPHCRTICRAIPSSAGKTTEVVPTIPVETEAFQAVTAADLKELGIDATQEQVDQWNAHVGMTPVELLSKLSGLSPREVMTKPLGVGTNPITFADDNIGFNVRGSSPSGVEFKLGAILEPFTGTYYLTQADLLAGNPKAEMAFLKQMFWSLIDMGLKSSATSVAVGVAGNAAYYARLGFLPDELEWDSLRLYALEGHSRIPEVLASLAPEDALLVKHLLQDKSVSAMIALVELPFTYQGKTIGEWLFGEAGGVWSLDLTDELLVAQAKAYLS